MTHCNGCPFSADCNGPADCDLVPVKPVVAVAQEPLSEMTIPELRAARLVAVDAGDTHGADLASNYISAAYAAQRDYRRADRFFREYKS